MKIGIPVNLGIDHKTTQLTDLQHWINIQHTGNPTIPLDVEAPPACVEAHFTMRRGRRGMVEVDVDRDGNWTFVGFKFV